MVDGAEFIAAYTERNTRKEYLRKRIAGYALLRVIHCIQSENIILETLTGI
jgi:hypothetical protein